MIAVADALAARLGAEATTLALCWRIVRVDGVALGLTAHDRALVVDGLAYRPAPGLQPSAITQGQAGEAHAMEITGALSEDGVREADLIAGRYDEARVRCFLVDWGAVDAGTLTLVSGRIGAIACGEGRFTAEMRTALDDLSAVAIERYSPTCRAAFGDRRCRVDLAARTRVVKVTAVAGALVSTDDGVLATDVYRYGRVRVVSGAASGIERVIDGSSAGAVTLRDGVPGLGAGARIEVREGCDKLFATCRDRFANRLNFRGEPHVPGADAIARYPGL